MKDKIRVYMYTRLTSLIQSLTLKVALIFTLFFPIIASAHPHAWVDTNTYIEADQTHIIALHMTWTFDAETSTYMLQGEDISADNIEQTLQRLAQSVVGNMYNEHYFTYLYNDNEPVRYKEARHPQLIQDGNKLVLSFELPLSIPIAFKDKEFKLYIYDETYFVDMSWLDKTNIQLSEPLTKKCSGELLAPKTSDELRAYTLSLASDIAPDNAIGQLFSQKYQLHCQ